MADRMHYAQTIRTDLLLKAFKSLVAKEAAQRAVALDSWLLHSHPRQRLQLAKPVLVVETNDPSYVYLQSAERKAQRRSRSGNPQEIGGYGALVQDIRNVIDTFLPAQPDSVPVRFNAEHIHTMLRTAGRAGWKVLESWNGVDCSSFSMSVVKKGTRK
jgi:hypothetical protein